MFESDKCRSISVSLLPGLLSTETDLQHTCSIVIDVLRATSVMVTAGQAGAARIITCQDIAESRAIANRCAQPPLLCGERFCKPIEGFDLGNSPAEYLPATVAGRDLILTTTNGTRAINAVMPSRRLLVASFLNLQVTVAAIKTEARIQIMCAGTDGQISGEDVLLAGAIVDRLVNASDGKGIDGDDIDDSARLAIAAWRSATADQRSATADQRSATADQRSATGALEHSLELSLEQSLGGRNLIAAGYAMDLKRCAQIDTIDGIVERSRSDQTSFEYKCNRGAGLRN